MSELIPDGWNNIAIDDFIERVIDNRGKTPPLSDTGYGLIEIGALSESGRFPNYSRIRKRVDANTFDTWFRAGHPKKGDILIPTVGTIGICCILDKTLGSIAQNLIALRVKPENNPVYAYYILSSYWTTKQIEMIVMNAVQPSLRVPQFLELKALQPPLPEQQKIAAILSSVDEVIEKTQAQINKLKDLKTGMMQELLSPREGQAATINNLQGESKNSLHHTEFKDSPLGRIPVGWEVVSLGQTGKWSGGGTPSKANKGFWGGNIPWVSPKDMKVEFIDKTQDYITEEAVCNSSTNLVKKNSLLMVVRSGILQHTLPLAIAARDLTLNQDMKALSVTEGYSSEFIYNYLQANNHKVLRATLKAGNTVESIDFNEFTNFLIPCPPLNEQEYIVKAVGAVAKNLRLKSKQLINHKNIKKALMQDLLTGHVRVNIKN